MAFLSKSFVALLGLVPLVLPADVPFDPATSYTLTCRYGGATGSVTVGSLHQSPVLLLYQTADPLPADGYWKFESTGDADTWRIRNAATGQYLQYSPVRIETSVKGLILADTAVPDSAEWRLEGAANRYHIVNVADPSQWLNLRTDGSWLLGTYASHSGSAQNELFSFYDAAGNPVESEDEVLAPDVEPGTMPAFLDSLYIGGFPAVYDAAGQRYLCSLPESMRGRTDLSLTLQYGFSAAAAGATLQLAGQDASAPVSLTGFSCAQAYPLRLLDAGGQTLVEAGVEFTFLPLVVLNSSPDCNGTDYTPGSIHLIDPSASAVEPVLHANLRYRGATAQGFSKKAFAVKITDAEGESMDHSFFGLRDDNNWILDAMAVDKARMRNRVSTDLWNAFSTRPYYAAEEPEMNPGTRGRFVEVVLNGNYHGIYCLTEKLDRKQLKIKKIKQEDGEPDKIRGVLYKSDQWSYEVLMGHDLDSRNFPKRAPSAYSNQSMTWASYEMDYPDLEDGESITWEPLYNAINFVATSSDLDFSRQYASWFDMPVWTDYYLFLDVLLATDNHGKNMFLLNYDLTDDSTSQLISMAPWDLDGTWGRRWDGSANYTSATTVYEDMLWNYEHGEHTLYYRLRNNIFTRTRWQQTLESRYAALRQGAFHPDSLKARFTAYYDLMSASGAVSREQARWNASDCTPDMDNDVRYITSWIDDRMAYLDTKYHYNPDSTTVGIAPSAAEAALRVSGEAGALLIEAPAGGRISVYDAAGRLVRRVSLRAGRNRVSGLAPGVYVAGGRKAVVR